MQSLNLEFETDSILLPPLENGQIFQKLIKIQRIRKNLAGPIQLYFCNGHSVSGQLLAFQNDYLNLLLSSSDQPDQILHVRLHAIEAIALRWSPELFRFFCKRNVRGVFPTMGTLEIKRAVNNLFVNLKAELRPKIEIVNSWEGATQEDFFILEDYLTVLINNLSDLQKEFPTEIAKLTTIEFTKPAAAFQATAQAGILKVQLPLESTAVLEDGLMIKTELNQILTTL